MPLTIPSSTTFAMNECDGDDTMNEQNNQAKVQLTKSSSRLSILFLPHPGCRWIYTFAWFGNSLMRQTCVRSRDSGEAQLEYQFEVEPTPSIQTRDLSFRWSLIAFGYQKCPTSKPTARPTSKPSSRPTFQPSLVPTRTPTNQPTPLPTLQPSFQPSSKPTQKPTSQPTKKPTCRPTPRRHNDHDDDDDDDDHHWG